MQGEALKQQALVIGDLDSLQRMWKAEKEAAYVMFLRRVWKLTSRQAWGTAWPSDPEKLSAAAAPAG